MRRQQLLLLLLAGLITIIALVLVTPRASAWQSGSSYVSNSGSWTVAANTVVAQETLTVNGNLNIQNGATLTIYNSVIYFSMTSDGQYTLTCAAGGNFYCYDTTITSNNGAYHYSFVLRDTTVINRSAISEVYGSSSGWAGGIQIYSSNVVVGNSTILNGRTGGIYVSSCQPRIEYNTIRNNGATGASSTYCFGIYTTSTNGIIIKGNIIHNNTYYYYDGSYYNYYYGCGIRMDYGRDLDSVSSNNIQNNGYRYTAAYNYYYSGYNLYLYYTASCFQDNWIGNGGYNIYLYYSAPAKIDGGTWYFNMPYYGWNSYQFYSYYSSANISNVNITLVNNYYGYYPCYLMYSTVNFTNTKWVYSETTTYCYLFYGVYVYSSTVNIDRSTFSLTCTGYYFYWFYTYGPSVINFRDSSMNVNNIASYMYSFYPIYLYNWQGTCSFNALNSTIIINDNCTYASKSVYGAYLYNGLLDLQNSTFQLNEYYSLSGGTLAAIYSYSNGKVEVRDGSTVRVRCNNCFAPAYAIYASGAPSVNVTSSTVEGEYLNYPTGGSTANLIYLSNSPLNVNRSTIRVRIVNTPNIVSKTFTLAGTSTVSITGCTINWTINGANCEVAGINIGQGATVDNMKILNNRMELNLNSPTSKPVRVVSITDKGSADFTGNNISLRAAAGVTPDFTGIYLKKSSPRIFNNTISSNVKQLGAGRSVGIYCDISSSPTIDQCELYGNSVGVFSTFFANPTILSSASIHDNDIGVQTYEMGNLTGSAASFKDNKIGLQCSADSAATLVDTVFINSGVSDIDLDSSSDVLAMNCTFNPAKVKFNDDNSTLTVSWWLGLEVQWQNGVPIPSADVIVRNAQGKDYLRAMTSVQGKIGRFLTTEYVQTKNQKTSYSPYEINVTRNGITNSQNVIVDITKDAVVKITDYALPKIAILSPPMDLLLNFTGVIVRGTASDTGSGLRAVKVSRDGTTWTAIEASSSWETSLTLVEGVNTISARAEDVAGNAAVTTVRVVIDLTRPVIIITSPMEGTLTNNITVEIKGTTEDGSTVKVDGVPACVSGTVFSFSTRLSEGDNLIHFFAQDRAGNTNEAQLSLRLDITAPPCEILSPTDGLLTTRGELTVNGRSEKGAKVTVNSKSVSVDDAGSFTVNVQLAEGITTITASAQDDAGNFKTASVTVRRDSLVSITIISPQDGYLTNIATVVIKGRTDTDAFVKMNGGLVPVNADGTFTTTYSLCEGLNTLSFIAQDEAANLAETSVKVSLDTTRPPLGLDELAGGRVTRNPDITITGTAEDGASVTVNGKSVDVSGGKFSSTLHLQEGANLITVDVVDRAGNTNTVSGTVILDTQTPPLEIIQPGEGFRTFETGIVVVGITEPGAKVRVNGTAVGVDLFGKFTTTVPLQANKNTISVTAEDEAGNSIGRSVLVVRTSKPPEPADNSGMIWTASGLLIAAGIMFPLVVLGLDLSVKLRRDRGH